MFFLLSTVYHIFSKSYTHKDKKTEDKTQNAKNQGLTEREKYVII